MCIGETFFWLAATSLIGFLYAGFVHYAWKSRLSDEWYKTFRLAALYLVASLVMIAAILSVLLGTDC